MENTEILVDGIAIDQKKLARMEVRILDLESKNMRTHERTDSQMVDAIKKIIEEEERKCY